MFSCTSSGKVTLHLSESERTILLDLFGQMRQLLQGPEIPQDNDPLESIVGLTGPTNIPADPALARLFPSGYSDDEIAASDFRRYTEPDLRAEKLSNIEKISILLKKLKDKTELNQDEINIWLKSLNDLRLVLGTRIGITEEYSDELADSPGLHLYDYLTYLQSTLIEVL